MLNTPLFNQKTKNNSKFGLLYLSYDGMLEPLGQSQVLSYLKDLSKDYLIHLISFEKPEDWKNIAECNRIKQDISSFGIIWHPLNYHKRPSALATAWDIFCGSLVGLYLVVRYALQIVHARSYVPSVMALLIKKFTGIKYLFDMRGFWVDERVDGRLWSRDGKLFQIAKNFEKRFLLAADHVVSLTHAAVIEMQKFSYLQDNMPAITVIPTCANLEIFTPLAIKRVDSRFTLGYLGTVGTWYLFDKVIACFKQLLRMEPNAHFLIVNRGEHAYISEQLLVADIPKHSFTLLTATHAEIPCLMAQMDAGIFFIKPVFSKQASAPTKLGEFLGCGIPCLSNAGVGDMAGILEGNEVGVALTDFDNKSLENALVRLINLTQAPDIKKRCREVAIHNFSLEDGVRAYSEIYAKLLSHHN